MKHNFLALVVVFIIGVLLSAVILLHGADALAQAGGPAIDWWVLAGGGAPATGDGDRVVLNDTLGQPIVGPSSGGGGRVILSAGYWSGAVPLSYRIYLPLVLRN